MDILNYIGNTPLVKLKNVNPDSADIYVKLEQFNAGGSIKSRVALEMIEQAELRGVLRKGMTLIEPTGGNTGMGLSLVSAIKGYKFVAVVPDNYSSERVELLKIHNATVILSDSSKGNDSHIKLAQDLIKENGTYVCLDQFSNQACIDAHFHGTAKEICRYIAPDAFVCCVGSSGTFSGVGKRLRYINPNVTLYVAQPVGCDIISGKAIPHKIQGTSLGIKPPLLDYSLIDNTVEIDFSEIRSVLIHLLKTQSLFLGASSGANIVAAQKLAQRMGKGKIVCTVAPDGGQYYINDIYKDVI